VVFGSIRPECLDDVIVLSVAGLQRILAECVAYSMHTKSHSTRIRHPFTSRVASSVMLVVAPCCWVCTGFADSLVRGGRAKDASWCVSEFTRLFWIRSISPRRQQPQPAHRIVKLISELK